MKRQINTQVKISHSNIFNFNTPQERNIALRFKHDFMSNYEGSFKVEFELCFYINFHF